MEIAAVYTAQPFGELKNGAPIETVVLMRDVSCRAARNGSYFLQMRLLDCAGRSVAAKLWDAPPDCEKQFDGANWFFVCGRVGAPFNGEVQIILNHLPEFAEMPANHADFLPCSPIALDELTTRFDLHLTSVGDTRLRALLDAVFGDDKSPFLEAFLAYPAAMNRHHACRHGLLQHTVEVADVVAAIADRQMRWETGFLWRDLAVSGALLHDIGKVDEFARNGVEYEYSTTGHLLGHAQSGLLRINKAISLLNRSGGGGKFDSPLRDQLLHLILSHHGRGEWGAAKAPLTPEAALLHHADKISSELFYFFEAQTILTPDRNGFAYQKKLDSGMAGISAGRNVFVKMREIAESGNNLPVGSQNVAVTKDAPPFAAPLLREFPPPVYEAIAPRRLKPLPTLRLRSQSEAREHPLSIGNVPLRGRVTAGTPIHDSEIGSPDEAFYLDADALHGGRHYLLHVVGDSMEGEGIYEDDHLLVRDAETAESGEIVIARFNGGATVKRLDRTENGQIRLLPANDSHDPIVVQQADDLTIEGCVVAVVRAR